MIYTVASLRRNARRLDRQTEAKRRRAARARYVLDKLKSGTILRKHCAGQRVLWQLISKKSFEFVHVETIADVVRDLHVVGDGDGLFDKDSSQTFRWTDL